VIAICLAGQAARTSVRAALFLGPISAGKEDVSMRVLISPAKNLDLSYAKPLPETAPVFGREAEVLNAGLSAFSTDEIQNWMRISPVLADQVRAWSQNWTGSDEHAAVFMFAGDVYRRLDPASWSRETRLSAQDNLRILSGMYGVLKPFDAAKPYRLEMGRRCPCAGWSTLYDYWGQKIGAEILNGATSDVVINLASEEYFKAAKPGLDGKSHVLSPVFLEERRGQWGIVSVNAKRLRGEMARWILEEGPRDAEDLKALSLIHISEPTRPY